MLVISEEQIKALELYEIEKFIKSSIKNLKENYSEHTESLETEELRAIINNVIAICISKQNNVITEERIFLMIVCYIKYGFKIPLPANLEKILSTSVDERLKVECFVNAVASKKYNLIALTSI